MARVAFAVASALPLGACDPGCPEGTYAEGGRCVRGRRTDGDRMDADASVREPRPDRDASDNHRDAAGAQDEPGHPDAGRDVRGETDVAHDASVHAKGGSGGKDGTHMGGAGAASDAARTEDAAGVGASPATAADGGVTTPPNMSLPSQDPPSTTQSPRTGKSLLFWGNTAVKYPFQGDALLRSERLPDATYRLTGKLSLRNPSDSPLDVTCTVQLNTAINMERISLPPADESGSSSVSLILACVGPTGSSETLQRASLTCTCASGAACNGLSFESLGIIAKVVAAGSGPIQRPAPATD